MTYWSSVTVTVPHALLPGGAPAAFSVPPSLSFVSFALLGQEVDAQFLGNWLFAMAAILAIAYMIGKIVIGAVRLTRREPPIDAEFATKREMFVLRNESLHNDDKIEGKIDNLRTEIKGDISTLAMADEKRSSGIHRRVDEVLSAVSRVAGQLDRINGGAS